MMAVRLHADGTPDTGFGDAGFARIDLGDLPNWYSTASGPVLQGERVVLGGRGRRTTEVNGMPFAHEDFALVRLSDGGLFADAFEDVVP